MGSNCTHINITKKKAMVLARNDCKRSMSAGQEDLNLMMCGLGPIQPITPLNRDRNDRFLANSIEFEK